MSVDVAAGTGIIPTAAIPYPAWSDATVNKTVTTANASNPRKDILVAYIDLTVPTTSVTNNLGALKFAIVAGTAAASPTDPTSGTIQTAVGAGNPWIYLARISVAASASSIVDANITDLRQPISFKGRLWGGTSNTSGHTVPNIADDTLALLAAVQTLTNKSMSGSTNTFTNIPASALTGIRLLDRGTAIDGATPPVAVSGQFYIQAGSTVGTFASNALDIVFSTAFPTGLLTVTTSNGDSVGTNPITVSAGSTTRTGFRAQSASNGAQRVNWIAVGW